MMDRRELTPAEYEEMASSGKPSNSNTSYIKAGVFAILTIVLCGLSFGAGISFQKGKQSSSSPLANTSDNSQFPSQASGGNGQGGQFGNGQRPNIGEVSAVSSGSITIQVAGSTSAQTFKVTGSTTIQNNGSTASIGDIKAGDTVLVVADSSDQTIAAQIMLNPNFGPPSGGGAQGSPSTGI